MAAKELLMNVVLGGKTTSGFDALSGKISGLGALFSEISDYAIDFEKESLETYKNYETYMLEAEGALTAQYKSASQLSRVMEGLDEHAQSWAESTIFDTQDMAKSISEAAHAGWDYEQMILGIPEAMLLAQAGNLDLSTSLDYVIKALNATQTPFEDADTMINQWAKAANSGATDISELGEALLRMGATARFADSNAELFTMLAVLADMGTVGAEAGTLVRNSMIRLIAPTEKASEVMAELGVTYEEAQEIASDDTLLENANKLLAETGFSAYDSTGKLKPFLDVYKELYASVNGMAEVDKNAVLSAIFPTRTITGALGLLEAASQNYDGLYQQIVDSEGYAAKIAEIQTSGLMGTFEELDSKWESFQLKIGEKTAPAATMISDAFGNMLDVVNAWPDETFAAIVGGVTTIAATGPSMMLVGGAMKLFSTLGVKGTAIMLLATGAGALAGYLSEISQMNFESTFGDLILDVDELGTHVDSLNTKFSEEQTALTEWSGALETAQTEYSELAALMAEDMLTAVLTSKTLSQSEQDALFAYGEGITKATLDGIQSAKDTDMTFLDMLFGDMESDSEKQAFIDSVGWTDDYYNGLYSDAYAIGEKIRAQMTAALQDGSLNEAERQAIQSSVDRLNEIQAEINKQMAEEDFYSQLHKAQRVSWDSINEYMTENAEKQAEELERLESMYDDLWGVQRAAHERAVGKATSDAERKELQTAWLNWETEFNREREAAIASTMGKYGQLDFAAFDALMGDSDHALAWGFMKQIEAAGALWTDAHGNMRDGFDYGAYLPDGTSFEDMARAVYELSQAGDKLGKTYAPFMGSGAFDGAQRIFDLSYAVSTDLEMAGFTAGEDANLALMEGYGEPMLGAEVDDAGISAAAAAAGASGADALEAAWGNPVLSASVQISGARGLGALKNGAGNGSMRNVMTMYAEGGRATEASIFGEAGAEWAIPEEHSLRTAELLDAARAASGFTWGELIGRTGGLNANVNHEQIQLHYAPVIHAQDAAGVEAALLRDKDRLMEMLRELSAGIALRDDVEVYA